MKILRQSKKILVLALALFFQTGIALGQDSSYQRGVSLYEEKRYAEALAAFDTKTLSGSMAANAAYYRALCLHQMGKIREAAQAYKDVIVRFPQSSAAQNAAKILVKINPNVVIRSVPNPYQATAIDWSNLPDQVKIPFRKGMGGHMYVAAELNGTPVTMMFDTGAASTTCTESWLTQNNIQVKRTDVHGRSLGVGGEVSTSLAIVTLRLGQLERKLPLMVQDDRGVSKFSNNQETAPPLLGQTFYFDLPYMIDDGRNLIVFSKPSPQAETATKGGAKARVKLADNEVPFTRVGGNIVVVAKINGRECEMYFDTGAGMVSFADRHLALCGLNRPTDAREFEVGGVGGRRDAYAFTVDSIQLGPVERKNVRAAISIYSNFDRPLLGQTFLTGLRYTIDPVRSVIRFE